MYNIGNAVKPPAPPARPFIPVATAAAPAGTGVPRPPVPATAATTAAGAAPVAPKSTTGFGATATRNHQHVAKLFASVATKAASPSSEDVPGTSGAPSLAKARPQATSAVVAGFSKANPPKNLTNAAAKSSAPVVQPAVVPGVQQAPPVKTTSIPISSGTTATISSVVTQRAPSPPRIEMPLQAALLPNQRQAGGYLTLVPGYCFKDKRYRVGKLVGNGIFASVWKCTDLSERQWLLRAEPAKRILRAADRGGSTSEAARIEAFVALKTLRKERLAASRAASNAGAGSSCTTLSCSSTQVDNLTQEHSFDGEDDTLSDDGDGEVAIKCMRQLDLMTSSGRKELRVLKYLLYDHPRKETSSGSESDGASSARKKQAHAGRRYIVKLLRFFHYEQHLCLVFEHMWSGLREALPRVFDAVLAPGAMAKDESTLRSLQAYLEASVDNMIDAQHYLRNATNHNETKQSALFLRLARAVQGITRGRGPRPANANHVLSYEDHLATSTMCAQLACLTVQGWSRQLLSALDYIHHLGFVHGDVKTDNFLVSNLTLDRPGLSKAEVDDRSCSSSAKPRWTYLAPSKLKICDFGNTVAVSEKSGVPSVSMPESTAAAKLVIGEEDRTWLAPLWYRAPETMLSLPNHASTKADCWAAGCVLFEVFTAFFFRHQLQLESNLSVWSSTVAELRTRKRSLALPLEAGVLFAAARGAPAAPGCAAVYGAQTAQQQQQPTENAQLKLMQERLGKIPAHLIISHRTETARLQMLQVTNPQLTSTQAIEEHFNAQSDFLSEDQNSALGGFLCLKKPIKVFPMGNPMYVHAKFEKYAKQEAIEIFNKTGAGVGAVSPEHAELKIAFGSFLQGWLVTQGAVMVAALVDFDPGRRKSAQEVLARSGFLRCHD
ncbi:unnamed protein product [Amoebophrya sp. A120]|nr:unnamed protein product [Amoebophrya sp. A120]|eukprot:GSA120T00002149001.1